MILTYSHMIKSFLFLECIVDTGGDKRVYQVVFLVTIAVGCTIDSFTLSLWSWFCLGNKFLEEPDRRIDKRRLAVGDVAITGDIEVLAQLMEQPPERWTIDEHLKDCVCETHVSSVDKTAGMDFHDGLLGRAGCQEGQQLGFFAR